VTTLLEERPAEVEIDPRIEARRAAVERDSRRRRRGRLIVAAAVAFAVLAGLGAFRTPLLDVDRIVVTGASHTSVADIMAASGVALDQALVDVDTDGARQRVERLVPWVQTARVSRSWPGSVRITVVERSAVAQVQDPGGTWFVVDADGRLLEPTAAPRPDLVTVLGTVPDAAPGSELVDRAARGIGILAGVSPGLRSRMVGMRFVGDDELELALRPAGVVAFGRAEQAESKLSALDTVLARVDQTCLATIDVRVPTKPLVTRAPDCEG
jgi:cell division protein FtsQ